MISTVFRVIDSLNYEKVYRCGENSVIDFLTEWPPQGTEATVGVECISFDCPLFIQFDAEDAKLTIDGS